MPNLLAAGMLIVLAVASVPLVEQMIAIPFSEATVTSERAYGPRTAILRADRRGHFLVDALVNGRRISMLADSGATAVVLTEDDARRAGFDPRSLSFNVPVQTGNGRTDVAEIELDTVEIDGIALNGVRAVVVRSADLPSSLLGMTFLGRLSRVNLSGDTLELVVE